MPKNEKPLVKFERFISNALVDKLNKIDEAISKIDCKMSEEDVANILEDANSLISFACGKDDALYEEWRYRFLINEDGKYFIFQGREIGVDPRDWSGKEDPED